MAKKAKDLKPGDREYNADTDKWNEKKPKTKPTPASNTRKKMKKATASAPKPATKTKKAPKPAIKKSKAPAKGLIKLMDPASTPKGPKGRKGKKQKPSGVPQAMLAINPDGAGKTFGIKKGNVSRNLGVAEKYKLKSTDKLKK